MKPKPPLRLRCRCVGIMEVNDEYNYGDSDAGILEQCSLSPEAHLDKWDQQENFHPAHDNEISIVTEPGALQIGKYYFVEVKLDKNQQQPDD